MTDIIIRNATKDREGLIGRELLADDVIAKAEDIAFMSHAFNRVVPILKRYAPQMGVLVAELLETRKIEGSRIREALGANA